MKCYLMYHIHVFEDETKDYKIIGVFTSYDKALDVKGKYSSELVGFKDYPSGFCIEEFEVVGLDVAKQRTVYVIFTYIYKDGDKRILRTELCRLIVETRERNRMIFVLY